MAARGLSGTIQIDADGSWVIDSHYGKPSPIWPDPIYVSGLERALDCLGSLGIRASVFVVGRDLEVDEKVAVLRRAVQEGHEICNHTWTHPFGLHRMRRDEIEVQVHRTHDAIERRLGVRAVGFRAPNYCFSSETVQVLKRLGYRHESSVVPTPLGGLLATAASLLLDRRLRGSGYFTGDPSLRLMTPHPLDHGLIELPLSVVSGLRLPFNASFLLLFQRFGLASLYRRLGTRQMRRHRYLNFVLHLRDFADDCGFRGTMQRLFPDVSIRLRTLRHFLTFLAAAVRLVPAATIATEAGASR